MKKIHYKNIGYPKTGTNWLYKQLINHPQVDGQIDFFYKEFNTESIENYVKVYQDYDVSFNLDTHVFAVLYPESHSAHPNNIHKYTTHLTINFRNLYDILESVYNMDKNRNPNFKFTATEFVSLDNDTVKMYCNTKKIFDDWKDCKLPVKYMFYDDLVVDPKQYMFAICDYIGLKPFYDNRIGVTFKTDKKEQLNFIDEKLIRYINEGISIIEDHTNRDLSHWKK